MAIQHCKVLLIVHCMNAEKKVIVAEKYTWEYKVNNKIHLKRMISRQWLKFI